MPGHDQPGRGRAERQRTNQPAARYSERMPPLERVVVAPQILAGKPVIRGKRLAVEFILQLPAAG